MLFKYMTKLTDTASNSSIVSELPLLLPPVMPGNPLKPLSLPLEIPLEY